MQGGGSNPPTREDVVERALRIAGSDGPARASAAATKRRVGRGICKARKAAKIEREGGKVESGEIKTRDERVHVSTAN